MTGELVKLKIEAYARPDYDQDEAAPDGSFIVMFNPENYKRKYKIVYEKRRGRGETAKPQKFKRIKEEDFELKFVLDGTGIANAKPEKVPTPEEHDVETKIQKLLKLAGKAVPRTHRTRFLKVSWGTLVIRCVLDSMDVDYTLFDSEGVPLRATVKLKLKGVKSDGRRVSENRFSSPDLTHIRTIKQGDRLDYLCYTIYRDASLYLKVARFNKLNSFLNLPIGQEILFPPLKNKTDADNE